MNVIANVSNIQRSVPYLADLRLQSVVLGDVLDDEATFPTGALLDLLDETADRFLEQPSPEVVGGLIAALGTYYDEASASGRLANFKTTCQSHALQAFVLEDPLSSRAIEKPRGYAGDAVMLDYIYKPRELELSPLGQAVHRNTSRGPNAQSVLWRRDYLAERICEAMESDVGGQILSVASGLMRELERVRQMTGRRDAEIWALEQDRLSLEDCVQSYADFRVRPINESIAYLFRKQPPRRYDLIYSAGLFDYLPDRMAEALVHSLYGLLAADGLLTIGNFTKDSHDRGFMEGFMDWSLIYRDEEDLIRLADTAVPGARYRIFRDAPDNVVYLEIRR
jgi:extracellular factor (EF) 3-hydroxypalmitic acid methyl ester biosynthesis protein